MKQLLLIFLQLGLSFAAHELTYLEEREVRRLADEFFHEHIVVANEEVRHEPFLGGMLRLIAHDCVAGPEFGPCEGCLNPKVKFNFGFEFLFGALNRLYDRDNTLVDGRGIHDVMSRADFWVLTSYEAVRRAARKNRSRRAPKPNLPFLFGRVDCPTSPFTDKTFATPNALGDFPETIKFFGDRFGFTPREVIALLGVHTLGRARRAASDFQGNWVVEPDVLDNKYYKAMMDKKQKWAQTDVSSSYEPPVWQWNSGRGDGTFMLNSDISFFKLLSTDDNGRASCTFKTCPLSPGAPFVRLYANDNALWVKDFSSIFKKFTEQNIPNLKVPIGFSRTLETAIDREDEILRRNRERTKGRRSSKSKRSSSSSES